MNRMTELLVLETSVRTALRHYESELRKHRLEPGFGEQNLRVALESIENLKREEIAIGTSQV
ncbi:hypothetical protein [Bhargavaea ginsengi]|uniref:hypothetical protein n=1 Tax=Bhargavaea ginsengi TaxID=426757 RepID=UPI003C775C11